MNRLASSLIGASRSSSRLQATVRGSQTSMAVGLRLTGWAAVTLLASLGLVTLLFVTLGGFTPSGTMAQLDNLASRYVAADAARRAQFDGFLLTALVLFTACIAFFRRPSLLQILTARDTHHD
jgi:hypothetical protein